MSIEADPTSESKIIACIENFSDCTALECITLPDIAGVNIQELASVLTQKGFKILRQLEIATEERYWLAKQIISNGKTRCRCIKTSPSVAIEMSDMLPLDYEIAYLLVKLDSKQGYDYNMQDT